MKYIALVLLALTLANCASTRFPQGYYHPLQGYYQSQDYQRPMSYMDYMNPNRNPALLYGGPAGGTGNGGP